MDILLTATRTMPLDPAISLAAVARDPRCNGFSGADLSALAREAAYAALRGCRGSELPVVNSAHFETALGCVFPSVSAQEAQQYLRTAQQLRAARVKARRRGDKEAATGSQGPAESALPPAGGAGDAGGPAEAGGDGANEVPV